MNEPLNHKRPNGGLAVICRIAGCGKDAVARDMCPMHYSRFRFGSEIEAPQKRASKGMGRHIQRDGYVIITVPIETPGAWNVRARMRRRGHQAHFGEILEHRYVMQCHLGRPLLSTEQVHHRDGDRTNNDISNLELKTGPHGKGILAADGIAKSISYLIQHANLTEQQVAALMAIGGVDATA